MRIFLFGLLFLFSCAYAETSLNVYGWADNIPWSVLKRFEEETGIKVNYDVYDSPEVMEAKLFAASSRYDLVVLTAFPYLARQIPAGTYQKLNRDLIPNLSLVDPQALESVSKADPSNMYAVPYIWGTSGFGYNKQQVEAAYPGAPVSSLKMLFDPSVVSRLSSCKVSLLDSPIDVFPHALAFLGLDPNSFEKDDLKNAVAQILKVRPHLARFGSSRALVDLANGQLCVAQGWSSDIRLARDRSREAGHKFEIVYVIPEEGAAKWYDVLAVPADAPHPKEAHLFVDFLLRPENMAETTNTLNVANCVPSSKGKVKKEIALDPIIYPSEEVEKRLFMDKASTAEYERMRSREWTRVKTGR